MTKHLLLIDDHALFRSGVGLVLAAGLSDVQLSEASSLAQALLCPSEAVDLVLLDVQLEGGNGLDGIAALKGKWPLAKVLVVTALQDARVVQEALARGAHGFVCKTETPARMLELIAQALADELPAQVFPSLLPEASQPPVRLTPRQCEVLDLLCQGLSNKMIGRRLNLSENTVRGHVQATLLALQVSSRSEAAFVARRLGLSL
ncbi:response regulator transcription factor [Pseudomonas sp. LS44]|uniref:response regulator n=1 Tax=Pseudomonas sp. LS44 TaxID=1357074 RepID=UPI00215B55F0|nr:response regulator transcription factor [Pseudomonas sp. LS44]UVE18067.1 response regulator transcription factor [Pseudomonas sp. LS44]